MRRYLPNLGAAEAKRVHQVNPTGLKSRNGPGSCALCVLSFGGAAQAEVGSAPPRFRTIQVCPKDLASALGQAGCCGKPIDGRARR